MTERQQRRLAAILAADIAGYSALMGSDDARTVRDLKAHQAIVLPMITQYGGRIIDTAGDGILAEFGSVVNAVECAVAIQMTMAERNATVESDRQMQFRIGINLGDVIHDDVRVYGDGVNIAARLEGAAEPGGICISSKAHDEISGKVKAQFANLGELSLKNIVQPVRAFGLGPSAITALSDVPAPTPPPSPAATAFRLAIPDKPSIAVLPFTNMSGDPDQEYFTDGVTEDIITELSRFHSLFVIARNSSFSYKGKSSDVRQVGKELGVRYLLEGSLRKSANRVRITAQLIDASTAAHLWADRFEGRLQDIFDLQDQLTISVVGAIAPKLEQAEIERAKRKSTESLDAYDYFLRGMSKVYEGGREAIGEAQQLFDRAIGLDPDFASAYGMGAWCWSRRKSHGWTADGVVEAAEAVRLARRAAELGKDDAVALCSAGIALAYSGHDFDSAVAFIDRALLLNPNLAAAWHRSGWVRAWLGESIVAIEHLARAMRLSPLDPEMPAMLSASAFAHFIAGRYDEASSCAEAAAREQPTYVPAARILVAAHALAGRLGEAEKALVRLRQLDPTLTVRNLNERLPIRRPEDLAKYQDGLRKAGLPEG